MHCEGPKQLSQHQVHTNTEACNNLKFEKIKISVGLLRVRL